MLEKEISGDEMEALFGKTKKEGESEEEAKVETEEKELEEEKVKEGVRVSEALTTEERVEKRKARIGIKPHDWSQKRRLSGEHMRTLGSIHAQFARHYQSDLSSIMKLQARITSNESEQIRYEEFISSLPNPTYMGTLALPPLEGSAVLQIDLDLALALVDRNLGGTGEPYLDLTGSGKKVAEDELRALSDIEQQVIEYLLESLLDSLGDRWKDIISIQPTFIDTESTPHFLGLAFPEDIVIVLEFDVSIISEIGELLNSKMRICYPYMTLQPITSLLTESRLYEAGRSAGPEQRINLNQVRVPVKCNLAREVLTVEDLLNLKVGDLIELDVELDQASDVVIGQSRTFWGKPGRFGRKKAVKIESVIKEEVEAIPTVELKDIDKIPEEIEADEFADL